MATNNVNFKIKNGLVVEGTTGTINGNTILTETASDQYIIDLVGGVAYVTSVSGDLNVTDGELSIDTEGLFDTLVSDGLATQTYVDDAIENIDLTYTTDDVTEGSNLYYTDARVDSHLSGGDGITYSSGTISAELASGGGLNFSMGQTAIDRTTVDTWYDANGAAADVATDLSTHETATTGIHGVTGDVVGTSDTQTLSNKTIENSTIVDPAFRDGDSSWSVGPTEISRLDGVSSNIQDQLDSKLESADLSSYATQTYVNDAVDALVDGAPGLLDTLNEIAAAINDDENYATTMTTALAGKQDELTAGNGIAIDGTTIGVAFDAGNGLAINGTNLTIDTNVIATKTYAEGVADDADTSARGYADSLASNYDAAGAAGTALEDANDYTDTQLESYTTTANLETTIDGYGFAYTSELPTSSDDLSEGVNNLYFTDARAKTSAIDLLTSASTENITIVENLAGGLTITAENGVADSTTDDLEEGETNLYFTDERAVDAVDGADITPATVTIDSYRKEEATHQYVTTASTVNVHSLSGTYESVKYLVRVVGTVGGTRHSQLTEILMTIDGNNNIAITEYGTIYTSENPLATFSATVAGIPGYPTLTATTLVGNTEIIAAATMLSWAD